MILVLAAKSYVATVASNAGWNVLTMDLRATGEHAWPTDKINRAPDHTSAQWAFWIGRPLLGQWIWDIHRLLDAIQGSMHNFPEEIAIAGIGPAGIVALSAAALDDRITHAITIDTVTTFVTDAPYEHQRMGTILPGMLKQFGDIPALASLISPRPLLIVGGVQPTGENVDAARLPELFQLTSKRYNELSKSKSLQFAERNNPEAFVSFLKSALEAP